MIADFRLQISDWVGPMYRSAISNRQSTIPRVAYWFRFFCALPLRFLRLVRD